MQIALDTNVETEFAQTWITEAVTPMLGCCSYTASYWSEPILAASLTNISKNTTLFIAVLCMHLIKTENTRKEGFSLGMPFKYRKYNIESY